MPSNIGIATCTAAAVVGALLYVHHVRSEGQPTSAQRSGSSGKPRQAASTPPRKGPRQNRSQSWMSGEPPRVQLPAEDDAPETPRGDRAEHLRERLARFALNPEATDNFTGGRPVEDLSEGSSSPAPRYKRGRRTTLSGPSTNLDETRSYRPLQHPKSPAEAEELRGALRKCHLFTQLDEDELDLVVTAMDQAHFVQGNFITLQDAPVDPDTERFMVIMEGEVSVIRDGTVVRVLRPGQFFGERHLMYVNSNCRHTHRVDTPRCHVFSLSSDDYRHIVTRVAVDKKELYEGFLDRVQWLCGLSHREKMQLADSLQPVTYNDGDYLIEYDTVGVWLYVIVHGEVEVFGRKEGEIVRVCDFTVGDCVGELEFLNNHRTVADVRAKGRVKAARLHRDHFELCMGPIVDVLRRSSVADSRFAYYRAITDAQQPSEED